MATHPEVTIEGSAAISGSVFGGGELGLTKGSVIVNIKGGTIAEDVYGGGSLANSNIATKADLDGDGDEEDVTPTTTVNLTGGTVERDVYGGGLGQLAKAAVTGVKFTAQEATDYNTAHGLSQGDEGYKTAADWKVEPADAKTDIEAKVYGNVFVNLNEKNGENGKARRFSTESFQRICLNICTPWKDLTTCLPMQNQPFAE